MIIGRDEQLNIPEDATLIVSVEPITVRPEEAAKLLGISRTKVYELTARAGRLYPDFRRGPEKVG